MASHIVFGKGDNGNYRLFDSCSVAPERNQAQCSDSEGSIDLTLDGCPGNQCEIETTGTGGHKFTINAADGDTYLILDEIETQRVANVTTEPESEAAQKADRIILDVRYRINYDHGEEEIVAETRGFGVGDGKTAYENAAEWLSTGHGGNIAQGSTYLALRDGPVERLPSIRFGDLATLQGFLNQPESFLLIAGDFSRPSTLKIKGAKSLSELRAKIQEMKGQVAAGAEIRLVHFENLGSETREARQYTFDNLDSVRAFANWIGARQDDTAYNTYTETRDEGGNDDKWRLRIGPSVLVDRLSLWTDRQEYVDAMNEEVDGEFQPSDFDGPEYREKSVLDNWIQMAGVTGEFVTYPWFNWLGLGGGVDFLTNGTLHFLQPSLKLELDLGEMIWDNPRVSVVATAEGGGMFMLGESSAAQYRANGVGMSGSRGLFYGLGAMMPIRVADVGENSVFELVPWGSWFRTYGETLPNEHFGEDTGNFAGVTGGVMLSIGEKRVAPTPVTYHLANEIANPDLRDIADEVATRGLKGTTWRYNAGTIQAPRVVRIEARGPTTRIDLNDIGYVTVTGDLDPATLTNNLIGQQPPAGVPLGTYESEWTARYKGRAGTAETVTAKTTIIVQDTTAPTIEVPETIEIDATEARTYVKLEDPRVSDLVTPPGEIRVEATGIPDESRFVIGETVISYTATDAAGNSSVATTRVIVTDRSVLQVTPPADIEVPATGPFTVISLEKPVVKDPADPLAQFTFANDMPADGLTPGLHRVLWTITSEGAHPKSATAEQNVTVVAPAPTITAPEDIVIKTGTDTTIVPLGTPVFRDITEPAGANLSVVRIPDESYEFPLGQNEVTWKVTNTVTGLSATDTQSITLERVSLPELTVPADVVIEATGPKTPITRADLKGEATATDPADPAATFTIDVALFTDGLAVGGPYEIIWTATNNATNASSQKAQKITVVDTTAPVLTVPADVTAAPTGELTAVELGTATATDIVTEFDAIVITNDAPANGFPTGTTIVTWKARDEAGNETTGTQKVTILPAYKETALEPLRTIAFAETFRFKQGSMTPEKADIERAVTRIRTMILEAHPAGEFPTGIPAGSVVSMDIIGHASTEGDAEANRKLSVRRAGAIKDDVVKMMMERAEAGDDVFGRLEIKLDNVFIHGEGETRPISGGRAIRQFGGHDNPKNAVKKGGKVVGYTVCRDAGVSDPMIDASACTETAQVDLEASRRTEFSISIAPPGTKVRMPRHAVVTPEQLAEDRRIAEGIINYMQTNSGARSWYQVKGIRLYYSAEDNTFYMIMYKDGFDKNLEKISRGFRKHVSDALKSLKADASATLRVKVKLFYEGSAGNPDLYVDTIRDNFVTFADWPFGGVLSVDVVDQAYQRDTVIEDLRTEIAQLKARQAELLAKVAESQIGDLRMATIPVEDPNNLSEAEIMSISTTAERLAADEGVRLSVCVTAKAETNASGIKVISNIVRSTHPALGSIYVATDGDFTGNYVTIVAARGEKPVDIDSDEGKAVRDALLGNYWFNPAPAEEPANPGPTEPATD